MLTSIVRINLDHLVTVLTTVRCQTAFVFFAGECDLDAAVISPSPRTELGFFVKNFIIVTSVFQGEVIFESKLSFWDRLIVAAYLHKFLLIFPCGRHSSRRGKHFCWSFCRKSRFKGVRVLVLEDNQGASHTSCV